MNASQIEQAIKENARTNFNIYSECYPIVMGLATEEAANAVSNLVEGYWDNRTEFDDVEGVDKIDYQNWITDAFEDWCLSKIEELKREAVYLLVGLFQRRIYDAKHYILKANFDDYVASWCKSSDIDQRKLTSETLNEAAFAFVEYDSSNVLLSTVE